MFKMKFADDWILTTDFFSLIYSLIICQYCSLKYSKTDVWHLYLEQINWLQIYTKSPFIIATFFGVTYAKINDLAIRQR